MQLADAAVDHVFLSDGDRRALRERMDSGGGQCRGQAEARQSAAAHGIVVVAPP